MVQFCEIMMLILFGISWPFNIAKSWKSKTAKGKSVLFELIVFSAYLVGLIGKLILYFQIGELVISTWFYFIDMILVGIDICLYFRNTAIDKANDVKFIE